MKRSTEGCFSRSATRFGEHDVVTDSVTPIIERTRIVDDSSPRCSGVRVMSHRRVFATLAAMTLIACAPTKVADPPADHPASPRAATRALPVLTKLEAPPIAASEPAPQPTEGHQHHHGSHP